MATEYQPILDFSRMASALKGLVPRRKQAGDTAAGTRPVTLVHETYSTTEDAPKLEATFAYSQISYVHICITIRAESTARVPWQVRDAEGESVDNELSRLLDYVNGDMNQAMLLEDMSSALDLYGNAYWYLGRSTPNGFPTEIWPLDPRHVSVVTEKKGGRRIVGYKWGVGQEAKEFPAEDVVHYRTYNPQSDILGLSKIEAVSLAANTDHEAARSNYYFLKHGATPTGLLTTTADLTDEQLKQIREQWQERYAGAKNAGRVMVMSGAEAKYSQTGLSPQDAQFIEQRRMSREEICGIFRTPAALVQDWNSARFANAPTQHKTFWADTMRPRITGHIGQLNEALDDKFGVGDDTHVEADFAGIEALQLDYQTLAETGKLLIASSQYNANEVRDLLYGAAPYEGGDVYLREANLIPVGSIVAEPEQLALPKPRVFSAKTDIVRPPGLTFVVPDTAKQLRDRYWQKQQDAQDDYRRAIGQGVSDVYRTLTDDVLAALRAEERRALKQTQPRVDTLLFDIDAAGELLYERLAPEEYAAYVAAGQHAIDLFDLGISLDMEAPNVVDWFAQKELLVKTIPETYHDQLRLHISEGMRTGESMSKIADRVNEIYLESYGEWNSGGADRIASTETGSAYNAATFESYDQAAIEQHTWLHSGTGDPPRPSHQDMNEVTRDVGEAFDTAPTRLLYPHDPAGGPEDNIYCKCTTAAVV